MTLASRLRGRVKQSKARPTGPLWKGPTEDGITQGLLSRFLVCRERFRLLVVEGLRPTDTFNHRMEYGQMWHICERVHAKGRIVTWASELAEYCRNLCKKYPTQQEQIQHWYEVCKTQFPIYVKYWSKHADVKQRMPLVQEETFDVSYKLPSGRVVRLRGRWDSMDLIGKGKSAGIYVQENKSKGNPIEEQLKRQLQFDLQSMFYLVAAKYRYEPNGPPSSFGAPIRGVRYNVVRRPLSGGRGSIRQLQASSSKPGETKEEFYARLGGIIKEDPGYFFMRWTVEVSPQDVARFKRQFLDPILEQLCDWWGWITTHLDDPFSGSDTEACINTMHYRTPYGFYNVLAEGGSTEMDEYLASGSELGLERTSQLFRELD